MNNQEKQMRLQCLKVAVDLVPQGDVTNALALADFFTAWCNGDNERLAQYKIQAEKEVEKAKEAAPKERHKCACGQSKDPDGYCDGSHHNIKKEEYVPSEKTGESHDLGA
jgi:CDGSH-type Zn-finger protein